MGNTDSKSASDSIITGKLPTTPEKPPVTLLSKIPKLGDDNADVKILKAALNRTGAKLDEKNGYFGTTTEAAVIAFQKSKSLEGTGVIGLQTLAFLGLFVDQDETPPIEPPAQASPPWYKAALKYKGKKESDPAFAAVMVPLWKKVLGRSLNSIQVYAWCGLGMAVALYWAGAPVQKGGEMARNWKTYGQEINYKRDGFPQGAIIWINNSAKCDSSSSNHVTQSNGWCTAADLNKKSATFGAYGGNQGNSWKVSIYSVSKICAVRYPKEIKDEKTVKMMPIPLPTPVQKSANCTGSKSDDGESTR